MAHARTQIRAALAAALRDLPTTGPRVFTARTWPLDPKERPGLVVTIPAETIDPSTIGAVKLDRQATVLVIGYDDGADVEDRLDRIAADVEAAVAADPTLGGTVKQAMLAATTLAVDGEGKPAGEIRLTFVADYRTTRAAPETIIP